MNQFRETLKRDIAFSVLQVCKFGGDRVEYQDRATTEPVFLWAIPMKETFDSVNDRSLEEQHCHRDFVVPRQFGCGCEMQECGCSNPKRLLFPPESGPSGNAQVYYEGWSWAVDKWRRDSVGASYVLETTRHVPRRVLTR